MMDHSASVLGTEGQMRCQRCHTENSDGAKFCSNCGNGLELRCPACASPHQPGARFCSNCGTALVDVTAENAGGPGDAQLDLARYVPEELLRKIRAARDGQTMRGERRTVTMLFADIQGSTAAAETMDPEEWADIMNGAFGHLIAPVYRYEGTLARLLGDAVLAFFGAPIAHEDDPARAVRAGLEIVAALEPYREEVASRHGIELGVRVGINTGLVVVGEVGSDLRVEYTALGDAINLAARMEQTARPGTVQVAQDTFELLGDEFLSEPLGPIDVKGRVEPVQAHRILSVRRVDTKVAASSSPLVGRLDELDQLDEVLSRGQQGIGGICTIVGEAGIGKSRLLASLRGRLDERELVADVVDRPGGVAWLRGRSRTFERNVPHATFIDVLTNWWGGVDDLDFPALAAAVEAATGAPDLDLAGFLANLVGVELPAQQAMLVDAMTPQLLHLKTTTAVSSYLEAEANRRPVVLVLDDVHWADAMSLTLAEELMAVTDRAPLVLVQLLRPDRDDPSWHITELASRRYGHRHTLLELEALTRDATDELLRTLLGSLEVDDDVRRDILERSEGNPLFVEEIVRSLGDASEAHDGRTHAARGQGIEVPRSLTGLLTARLDHLDEPSRRVAQVAAVIGREFDVGTLAAAAGDGTNLQSAVSELLRRGILEERVGVPVPAWSFRHPLIQETAYSTVLLKDRRPLHGRIARYLEASGGAVQEVARHYLEGGEPTLAFPHLVAAGTKALRVLAVSDAITYFSAALQSPPDDADPELVLACHDGMGEAYSMVPDLTRASAAFQSLREFGQVAGRPSYEVTALNRLGFSTAVLSGDMDAAMGYLRQAKELAEATGDEMGLAEYHMNACFVTSQQGDLEAAIGHDAETARIGALAGNETIRLTGLVRQTINLVAVSRFAEAEASYRESLEVAEDLENEELVALLHCDAGAPLKLARGDIAGAMDLLGRHLPTLDRYLSYYGTGSHHWMHRAAMVAGMVETALAELSAAERLAVAVGQEFGRAAAIASRARVLAACGMPEGGDESEAAAIALVEKPGGDFMGSTVWLDLAARNVELGRLDAAEQQLDLAAERHSISHAWERPWGHLWRTRIALERGQPAAGRRYLDGARTEVATIGFRLVEPELLLLDGAVAAAEGRVEDAGVLLGQALDVATELGAKLVRVEALARLAALRQLGGEDVEAGVLRDRAHETIRELAGLVVDEPLRDGFLRRWTDKVTTLAGVAVTNT